MFRNIWIFFLLATSFMSCVMFLCKWWDTSIDEAWKTFEDHVDRCMGPF